MSDMEPRYISPRDTAPDFAAMTDAELEAAISDLDLAVEVISGQLQDDLAGLVERDERWRRSASTARNFKRAHLHLARREQEKRAETRKTAAHIEQLAAERDLAEAKRQARQATVMEEQARAEAARQERLTKVQVAQAAKAAALEQHQAAWERREARRARMFLVAARRHLSKAELARLWAAAEEMFPGAPEWEEFPPARAKKVAEAA